MNDDCAIINVHNTNWFNLVQAKINKKEGIEFSCVAVVAAGVVVVVATAAVVVVNSSHS